MKISRTLVMVMKSGPKKTDLTFSILNRSLARGEHEAVERLGKSMVPEGYTCRRNEDLPFKPKIIIFHLYSYTGTPGINFKLLGFGVS